MYTPSEVTQLVGTLEELIEEVESLSTQLQKAETLNRTLLAYQAEMYDLIHNKEKIISVH